MVYLSHAVPLLGFCGAPMTLAIYMIEGGGSRTFAKSSRLMNGDPQTAHELLAVLAHMCAHYLINQVKAGAQALQVFDSYAGVHSVDVHRKGLFSGASGANPAASRTPWSPTPPSPTGFSQTLFFPGDQLPPPSRKKERNSQRNSLGSKIQGVLGDFGLAFGVGWTCLGGF